ncbi:DUF1080 domain-containing protein [Rubellicoccus peritrichatus]|uniref:DUF1080 domain-containing protein n=1 Tax=Rubellicoccus peritrichatus TaxID=3080537 RepID=A0AAQ3L7Y9_9BACT|nr:DUF1080 domain-containing protein [Puniceicoccus sp. CR14]WOO40601.1 DUF1080 domain-containing protein [Puniceicoccus sp. CR14]
MCRLQADSDDANSKKGFTPIFNGQSLEGWHIMEREADDTYYATEENFFVKDGVLHCFQTQPSRKGGLILSDDEYGDFELIIDVKSDWGCDSGIFLRCTEDGRGIQVLNDYLQNGCIGFLFGQGTGAYISRPIRLYGHPDSQDAENVFAKDIYDGVEIDNLTYSIGASEWNKVWRHGEWNTLKIRCTGSEPVVTTWVNGVKIMEMDGSDYQARHLNHENVQNWDQPSAWDSEKVQRITGNRGSIALQIHPGGRWKPGGSAMYRNIRIREL